MIRIFGHYISLRAIFLASVETVAFALIYLVARYTFAHLFHSRSPQLYGEAYFLPLFCLIAWGTAAACGLYNKEMFADTQQVISRLLTVSVLMYFLMALVVSGTEFMFPHTANLRLYYAVMLISSMGYLLAASLFRFKIFAHNFNGTALERRVLVVGVDECASKIERLNGHSRSPYKAVGFVPFNNERRSSNLSASKVLPGSILQSQTGLVDMARKHHVDEIVVASRERRGLPIGSLMECKLAGVTVTDFSSFWERQTGQIDLEEVSPHWLIFSDGFRMSWLRNAAKRLFDILVASLLLIVSLPVTVISALIIKLDSPGPIFYRQERVGSGGKLFSILKFRSMRTDAEKDGVPRWAQNSDSRITRFGNFMRRTRIDEIPQVINVLLGQMSFVGPRPERPIFVESLTQAIPYYGVRHRSKPGITGWAQINYPYGASEEDARAKLAYDLYYVKNNNLFLDALILFQTARVVFWREGAR